MTKTKHMTRNELDNRGFVVEPINGGKSGYQITTDEDTGFLILAETECEDVAKYIADAMNHYAAAGRK